MARLRRPHLPGVPFHITARLQGRSPWLVGLEPTVIRWIREYAAGTASDLLAFSIMPNHLHIVLVQGSRPLSEFMQPLLRRLALLVHSRHGSEGHVFQRRFHSSPCMDPGYLRNSIAYVHLNPVRARLCTTPEEYAWSMHAEYCLPGAVFPARERGAIGGLRLFSPEVGAKVEATVANYRAFLEWRLFADSVAAGKIWRAPSAPCHPPGTVGGDIFWAERYGWTCYPQAQHEWPRRPQLDLRDLALKLLREVDPNMSLELLRSGERTRALVAVRRRFIARARESGHRNRSIARFLAISDVTVSRS